MVAWGRADLHMHTTASDGWPSPSQLVDHAARRAALNVIAVTDHDTIEGALRAAEHAARRKRLHVIVGEEVSSRDGHIVGLFLERRIKPGMSAAATVSAIHDQGGLAIAAHPFWRTERQVRSGRVDGVGWLAAELDFDGVEVENATPGFYVALKPARAPFEPGPRRGRAWLFRCPYSGCGRPRVHRVSGHHARGVEKSDREWGDSRGAPALSRSGFDEICGVGFEPRAVRRGSLSCRPVLTDAVRSKLGRLATPA